MGMLFSLTLFNSLILKRNIALVIAILFEKTITGFLLFKSALRLVIVLSFF